MRSAPYLLLLLTSAQLVAPHRAFGQHGKLPWQPGDAPPAVAGLHLGAARATIDSLLGKPESVQTVNPGQQLLGYRTRGIALLCSDRDSLLVAYIASPEAGDIGGVRVGDSRDSVVARWGEPTGAQENLDVYQVGRWVIVVQFDPARGHVQLLGVGPAAEEETEEGPFDATADAHADIEHALNESRADRKLVLLDFGANWCLDCQVLEKLMEDSAVAAFLSTNFRVVHVDVGEFDRNLDISKAYGSPIDKGVPAVVVLSPSGDTVASTKDGSLESARSVTAQEILAYLQSWVEKARR